MEEKYLKQNDSGMYVDIQKIGCFFRSACHMAELQAKAKNKFIYKLSAEEINRIWTRSLALDYIDRTTLNVKNSANIATLALQELGCPGYFVEVATFNNGNLYWYNKRHEITDYIQKIDQAGPNKTHFRNVDKFGELLWDPHEPEIKVQGIQYTICYRYEEQKK